MPIIQYKGINLAFSDSGTGKVVVLLHGFLENQKMWDKISVECLHKFRVITIDLLGHGKSGSIGYIHSMEDQADAVFAILQSLKVKKCAIIGHSMGGYVALAFAELYPERVTSIVLQNSTAIADSSEKKTNRDRAIVAVKKDYNSFINLSIANLFAESNRESCAEAIVYTKNEALKTPLQGVVASLEGMKIRADRQLFLHHAKIPITIILGKEDSVLPLEDHIKQVDGTDVKLKIIDGGHMSHFESFEALADIYSKLKF